MSAQSDCGWILSQHKKWFRLTCTSITSCKIHFKSSQSSNLLQKSHTEPIFCFAWIPIVVFDNYSQVGDRRFVSSIQQTAHYSSTQNDFPVPPFIRNINLSMQNPFRRSNSQKMWSIKSIFGLKPRKIAILSSIDRSQDSLMVMTTDQLLWHQKNIFPRCCL